MLRNVYYKHSRQSHRILLTWLWCGTTRNPSLELCLYLKCKTRWYVKRKTQLSGFRFLVRRFFQAFVASTFLWPFVEMYFDACSLYGMDRGWGAKPSIAPIRRRLYGYMVVWACVGETSTVIICVLFSRSSKLVDKLSKYRFTIRKTVERKCYVSIQWGKG